MKDKNTCWDCKNNKIQLKILVPQNATIKEYVRSTENLRSDIVAVVKEKLGQYTIWFRYGDDLKLVTFKIVHVCALRIERGKKEVACVKFEKISEQNLISNITYSKIPASGTLEVKLPKLNSICSFPKMQEQLPTPF